MARLSVEILKRRLRRTTWLPLGIMAALFLGAMGLMLLRQHQSHMKSISLALDEIVRNNETQITQDVFLGQEEGIKLRIQDLLENWQKKYPDVQACIRYTVHLPDKEPKSGGLCAFEANIEEMVHGGEAQSLDVKVGNRTMANLRYTVVRPTSLFDVFPPLLLVALVTGLLIAVFSHSSLVKGVEANILSPLIDQMKKDERDAAIAETTKMLAHDIRKPFHAVQFALVRLKEAKNKQARELGESISGEIEQNIKAVNSMLRDILDVSRKMKPNPEVVSIGTLMDRLEETIHSHFAESKVKLKLDYRRRHRVMADPEQLMRVLLNLLDNAYQAVGETGTVKVTVKELDPTGRRRIQFSVHNDGPTIPEGDLKNLSTPYFTKRKDGTGLGLTIAKKIVEEHGGAMAWYSTPEKGTCFSFALPAASGEENRPQLRTVAPNEKVFDDFRDRHVLIFDDEKTVRDHWSAHAKKVGFHTVLDFKSWEDFVGQDGYKFVDPLTVAFVDIHFNRSRHDGLEIAKQLKKIGVTKIYAITGDIETAKESGLFTDVFGKEIPTNFRSLVG